MFLAVVRSRIKSPHAGWAAGHLLVKAIHPIAHSRRFLAGFL
jgi:hypothetical protein